MLNRFHPLRLPIVQFHNPVRDGILRGEKQDIVLQKFEALLVRLRKHFRICGVSEAVASVYSGERRVLAITFDDGYRTYLDGIVGILSKHHCKATFFVCSELCLSGENLWNDRLLKIMYKNSEIDHLRLGAELERHGVPLPPVCLRDRETRFFLEHKIKYLSTLRRSNIIVALYEKFGESADPNAAALGEHLRLLSAQDLLALRDLGMEIGGHTATHALLACETPEAARRQIEIDYQALTDILGCPPSSFAYPNGIDGKDFFSYHQRLVREVGYQHAVSSSRGLARLQENELFSLSRVSLPIAASRFQLAKFYLNSC